MHTIYIIYITANLQKTKHKDGLGYNFNQLRVTFLFLCLNGLF